MVGPFGKFSSTILIAQHTILCVRNQPTLVFSKEFLKLFAVDSGFSFLLVYKFQILFFKFVYTFVVYLRQRIQLFTFLFEAFALRFVLQCRQTVKVCILRVQRKDRDTAVRVRVCPRVCDGSIVDWQDLKYLLLS